ncbi:MAG TPA: lecithin retinol acyltransferase family protein [Candidatus Binatia bacterium]|nr:lecithin retinol acyltransferase family protein [Candidatus Binatia bacterium]
MARGDHICVNRLGYTHHGIDCGDQTVIHYTGEFGHKRNAAVRRTPLCEFLKGGAKQVCEYAEYAPADAVIARAERRLGEENYNLAFSNCEHFARWCKTGRHHSEQVRDAVATVGSGVGAGSAVAAGVGIVAATGRCRGSPRSR